MRRSQRPRFSRLDSWPFSTAIFIFQGLPGIVDQVLLITFGSRLLDISRLITQDSQWTIYWKPWNDKGGDVDLYRHRMSQVWVLTFSPVISVKSRLQSLVDKRLSAYATFSNAIGTKRKRLRQKNFYLSASQVDRLVDREFQLEDFVWDELKECVTLLRRSEKNRTAWRRGKSERRSPW